MKPTLNYPTWSMIEKGTARLAIDIVQSDLRVSCIIGLARGGLIPAVLLSHMLDVPMLPASYSSKEGHGDNKDHNNVLPDPVVYDEYHRIIIVDDIADSGLTLHEVKEHYKKHYNSFRIETATLYYKTTAKIRPDYYWHTIPAHSEWIVFPWED